jgi:outer membrane protein assembly factor BamB
VFTTPAVAGRLVIAGSCAGKLLALDDSTGAIVWQYDTSIDGSPAQFHGDALVTEDLVVVGTDYRFHRTSLRLRAR